MIYVATFLGSIFFGHLATRINPKTNRGLVIICSLISILIPSVLAGLRDVSIGTDVTHYLLKEFNVALSVDSFKDYLPLIWRKETGYLALVFLVAKCFGDIQWLLFFMSFITTTCFYIGAWRFKEKAALPLTLLIYFLCYYNISYNLVRQAISMAIIFCGIGYLFKKKYIKFLILVAIATLFHSSAILSIVHLFIFWFLDVNQPNNAEKKIFLRSTVLIFALAMAVLLFPTFITLLSNIGLIDSRFLYYVQNPSNTSSSNFETLIYAVEILAIVFWGKSLGKIIDNFEYFKTNLFYAFITILLTSFMLFGNRISQYFSTINILLIGQIPGVFSKKSSKVLCTVFITTLFFVYWFYVFVISGSAETYPFKFFWEE